MRSLILILVITFSTTSQASESFSSFHMLKGANSKEKVIESFDNLIELIKNHRALYCVTDGSYAVKEMKFHFEKEKKECLKSLEVYSKDAQVSVALFTEHVSNLKLESSDSYSTLLSDKDLLNKQ